jgi:coenzyme F420 hydrogenase subunit beta
MEALERMKISIPDGAERESTVSLRLGIFCTWALDYRRLKDFLSKKGVAGPIKKYDIPPPPSETFIVFTDEGRKEFALGEIRGLVQKGCSLCQDLTAENADISVGTVEGEEHWNTVIIRSDRGEAFFDGALKKKIIEKAELPDENLNHLSTASCNKRERGKKAEEDLSRKR